MLELLRRRPTRRGRYAGRSGLAFGRALTTEPLCQAWLSALGALAPLKAGGEPAAARPVAPQAAPELRSAAAAALEGADAPPPGAPASVVVVAETRRFAGEDVRVERAYEPGSRAAREAAARAASKTGLDAALRSVEARKGMTALEKTRLDWAGAKAAEPAVAEDLARHVRSADAWRGQQDFLARAAESEYEREREARAAADARARSSRR